MNGTDLLAQFRDSRSESAFSELVRRYTNLVYSAARRRLANDALAQEATQIVFIRLARTAPNLRNDAALAAWLHRTTLHVSVDLWRSEFRRAAREEQAAAMQPDVTESALWNEITPVLDEALNQLNDVDRQTLLLRFFQQKSMRDLGTAFGVSEDAAKMRVSRALERLRRQLTTQGVACTAIVLGALLAQRSVEAVPAQLTAALASISWPAPATGLGGLLLRVSAPKLAAVAAGLILAGAIAVVLLRTERTVDTASANPALAAQNAGAPAVDTAVVPAADVDPAVAEPDGLKLLQAVARARNRFASGTMTLEIFSDRFETGHKETNYLRSKVVFDGSKKWFDSATREFAYVSLGAASEEDKAKIQAQNLDREGAVRAGLLKGFEAHYVTAYDTATYLEYRETDGRADGATISGPDKGSPNFLFDPRCLGLRSGLYRDHTIENCLGYDGAASVKLIGLESVDGVSAWHINVRTAHAETLDFWIDAARPVRVLRHVKGRDMVNSKYDDATPDNPVPIEVTTTEYHQGALFATRRFVRSRAEFNPPVDPSLWTLAGLGMKVGTRVTDVRIHRGIGYWTGSGLEPFHYSSKKGTNTPAPPDRAAQLALLENDPSSAEALAASKWIVLNSPDGPDVEKAADVILQYHIRDPDLANLAQEQERMRHRCSRKLLEAMLEQNPNSEVRATACFTLATLLKDLAEFGKNKESTRDAEKYFEQVVSEFSRAGAKGREFARQSKPALYEMRHLFIGHPALEMAGEDLDGDRLKLSDYRGKVVVLYFWYDSTAPEVAEFNTLMDQVANRPFAAIGVYCENDLTKAKAAVDRYKVSWPSVPDGNRGPIADAWQVHSWLSSFVIDAKGVIRHRDLRGRDLFNAVETLLRE